jgi:hypothetical protein
MGNVTGTVAAKFAFFPPEPPTYEVFKGNDGVMVFSGTTDKNVDVHIVDTKGGNKVVATFWKHPFARFTILYSHGNAADLGQMVDLFIELRAHLRVNIMRLLFLFLCKIFLCFISYHFSPYVFFAWLIMFVFISF